MRYYATFSKPTQFFVMQDSELPNITVSDHLIMFSKALRPCLEKTERTLHRMSHSGFARVDGMDNPEDILERVGMFCENLSTLVDTMMSEIIANPNVSMETTYRHVGRFEGNLDILLGAYEQAIYTSFHGYPEAQQLLISALSNILGQVRNWLHNICDTIDHPLEAYRSRNHLIEDGTAVFSFQLQLEAPAEIDQLSQFAQNAARSNKSDRGFWSSIHSLILGFAIADWLFDDD